MERGSITKTMKELEEELKQERRRVEENNGHFSRIYGVNLSK